MSDQGATLPARPGGACMLGSRLWRGITVTTDRLPETVWAPFNVTAYEMESPDRDSAIVAGALTSSPVLWFRAKRNT